MTEKIDDWICRVITSSKCLPPDEINKLRLLISLNVLLLFLVVNAHNYRGGIMRKRIVAGITIVLGVALVPGLALAQGDVEKG